MSNLIFGIIAEKETMMYLWITNLSIILIIIIVSLISKRIKDEEEDFRRNFKIGIARTLGAITTIFFIWTIITTIIYFQKTNNNTNTNINENKTIIKKK